MVIVVIFITQFVFRYPHLILKIVLKLGLGLINTLLCKLSCQPLINTHTPNWLINQLTN